MALIDDPIRWILRLFAREEREGRGSSCEMFPDGIRPAGVPLAPEERVYGIYKRRYYFTPQSFIMMNANGFERIPWKSIRACSSRHGEGMAVADLTLTDGAIVRVRVGDFATGWSGRISQLFHLMIEKWGARAYLGPRPLSIEEFFSLANEAACFAPNLDPHPPLQEVQEALNTLRSHQGIFDVLLSVVEVVDGVPVAEGVIVTTLSPVPDRVLADFATRWGADWVMDAPEDILRALPVAEGRHTKVIIWD